MRITLATYNIRACVGRDGRFDPDRIAAVLRELGADAVALQEVESRAVGGRGLLEHLARETGMEAIDGPTLHRESGRYGNALLTRARILRVLRVDLSVPGFEKRGAIHAELAWPERRVQVVCTHLGLRARERRWQALRVLDLIRLAGGGDAAAARRRRGAAIDQRRNGIAAIPPAYRTRMSTLSKPMLAKPRLSR